MTGAPAPDGRSAARAAFPWDEAMRLALGRLGWTPATFWRATPRELAAALEGRFGVSAAPADRATLQRLMRAFPDA